MAFYFKAWPEAGDYTIFMDLDKHENEDLIKYGFPEDICRSAVQEKQNQDEMLRDCRLLPTDSKGWLMQTSNSTLIHCYQVGYKS